MMVEGQENLMEEVSTKSELELQLRQLENEYELAKDGISSCGRLAPLAIVAFLMSLVIMLLGETLVKKTILSGSQFVTAVGIVVLGFVIFYSIVYGRVIKIRANISKKKKQLEIETGEKVR